MDKGAARYRPIADYALIGDCEGAALISADGSIDWLCLPHFDSPAWLLKLLDADKGGYCAVRPDTSFTHTRRYLPDTNLLETTLRTETGRLTVLDFMPREANDDGGIASAHNHSAHSVVRLLECTLGTLRAAVTLKVTPGYATEPAELRRASARHLIVRAHGSEMHVRASFDLAVSADGCIVADVTLQESARAFLVLTATAGDADVRSPLTYRDVTTMKTATHRYWREWMANFQYQGPYRDSVARSALTLKLLTFTHTGAVIAAPTTSLPEEIGGERNWDYRFSWLRDSSFTLMALLELGFRAEAQNYLAYLARIATVDTERLRILYSIWGERAGAEQELRHLEGYRGSQPVRVGNAAAEQQQLDVYGEVVHAIYLYTRARGGGAKDSERQAFWPIVQRIGDYVAAHWREPDSGIWEVRGSERHFVHSKGMCYAALACALMLAKEWRVTGNFAVWERECAAVRAYLWHAGFNEGIGAFTQSVGSEAVDAALLRFPLLGIIDANDPRMRATVARIEERLTRDRLVYRYVNGDGVPGSEAAFAICTFWLIGNYVMQRRLDEAETLFEHMLSFANDVGLYAEEIDPVKGEQLGNFPQGFTHIGLIHAAARIAAARRGEQPFSHHLIPTTR